MSSIRSYPCKVRTNPSSFAPQPPFKPRNVLPWVEPEDWASASRVRKAKASSTTELGRVVGEEFVCLRFTECKMCHLVKFHWKYLCACCDSERKNKREADIWERKSVTLKYQKFGLNRRENFLSCHFDFWAIHVCFGEGVLEAAATISPQWAHLDEGCIYGGILETTDSFIQQIFTESLPCTTILLGAHFRCWNRWLEYLG